ncbi:MAG: tyrosine-type recombinase/integrase [Thiopseudomonas sp.]|nr:tyrosine-type recombinase/integrase [Thiopseudomonas sp.]
MRPRKKNRHLPACMYLKHGCYYYVKANKWRRLDPDFQTALLAYAKITIGGTDSGMPDLIDRVMVEMRKTLKKNTLEQYAQAAQRCKEVFAEFEPSQVMPKHIAAYKVSMSKTPSMANRIISFLREVFRYALEWQLVDANPCQGIRRYTEHARERYITDDEFSAILSQCKPHTRNIFLMSYLTGQRIGDVLAINLSDVTDKGIFFTQEKTGARLIVAPTDDVLQLVQSIMDSRPKSEYDRLFASTRAGRPIAYTTVKEAFATARKLAGVEDVTIHDIRAKSLTDAKRQGLDAQKLSGHTDARMTARYIRAREIDIAQPPSMSDFNK